MRFVPEWERAAGAKPRGELPRLGRLGADLQGRRQPGPDGGHPGDRRPAATKGDPLMAMTRGIQPRIPEGGVAHMDDGELLDREGKPIPTTGHVVAPQPPPEAPERTGGLTFLPVDEAPPAAPEPAAQPT